MYHRSNATVYFTRPRKRACGAKQLIKRCSRHVTSATTPSPVSYFHGAHTHAHFRLLLCCFLYSSALFLDASAVSSIVPANAWPFPRDENYGGFCGDVPFFLFPYGPPRCARVGAVPGLLAPRVFSTHAYRSSQPKPSPSLSSSLPVPLSSPARCFSIEGENESSSPCYVSRPGIWAAPTAAVAAAVATCLVTQHPSPPHRPTATFTSGLLGHLRPLLQRAR